jgi:hypothetical protein
MIQQKQDPFPVVVGEDGLGQTILFEHEVGTDQVNPDGSTTVVTSFIKSYDFDLNIQGTAGEVFLAMRRFVPDFKTLENNAKVTLAVKRYPQDSDTTTSLSPIYDNINYTKEGYSCKRKIL